MDVYGRSTKFKTQKIRRGLDYASLNEGSFKFILMRTTPRIEMKCSTFCVHDGCCKLAKDTYEHPYAYGVMRYLPEFMSDFERDDSHEHWLRCDDAGTPLPRGTAKNERIIKRSYIVLDTEC